MDELATRPPAGRPTDGDDALEAVGQFVERKVKPRLRGWLHFCMAPLAAAAGIVLVVLAPTTPGKVGGAVFLAASLLLFGISGVYHRFTWGARGEACSAGWITPTSTSSSPRRTPRWRCWPWSRRPAPSLLIIIWTAAVLGLVFRLVWLSAPRWLYTALYIVMGWAAVGWLPQIYANGGPAVFYLIIAGGLLYTAGAIVYARKRPDPSPRWFGFHEIFHSCTIAAFAAHYTAISLLTYAA